MRLRWIAAIGLCLAMSLGTGFGAAAPRAYGEDIELIFTYGSEKKNWIQEVTKAFNESSAVIADGRRIQVKATPIGSGEIMDELLSDPPRRRTHLVSPASQAFIVIGNGAWREKSGADLIGPTRELVSSPIVVAMWRDMATALGWPDQPIRWDDVFRCASDPSHWKSIAKPAWGTFKFGHTHPSFSNSGLHGLFVEAYAAVDKFDGVSRADVANNPKLDAYLKKVEGSVVHYGESTGFLGEKMFQQGRGYLTAAILYENLVIDANKKAKAQGGPAVVAIYPEEGVFPSEHPVGIVQRDWVTPAHSEAAEIYIKFLRDRDRQLVAVKYGFRPYDAQKLEIDLGDLLKPEWGVDPRQPKKLLKPPPDSVIRLLQTAWKRNKRSADVVLAIDASGSMSYEGKMVKAMEGANAFVQMLDSGDRLSILSFSQDVKWVAQDLQMNDDGKAQAVQALKTIKPDGPTPLYAAINQAHEFLKGRDRTLNRTIVVLSDGKNNWYKKPTFDETIDAVRNDGERNTIYVFTIGYEYGDDQDPQVLKDISNAAKAKYLPAAADNIRTIFKEIATFF